MRRGVWEANLREISDFQFRDVQKVRPQGRSERKPEAYGSRYVEGLSEARTKWEGFFNVPHPEGSVSSSMFQYR